MSDLVSQDGKLVVDALANWRTSEMLHFYSRQYDYLIKITHIKHILFKFLSLWQTVYLIVQLLTVSVQNINILSTFLNCVS